MSIPSQTKLVKNEVKCFGFWRKTSTATTKESVSKYIMSYVDETSKADPLAESRKLGYADVQFGKTNAVELGIGYLSKEEKGRIRVFGYLRDDVEKQTGMPPNHLTNDSRVIASHRAWMSRIEKHAGRKKLAHKFVFSLDPRFCELMAKGGKDCDALLIQGVRTVLRRFQEKYYPGDRLGYLVGIHHDRQHVHAHVLLLPWSENGVHLNVTDGVDNRFKEFRQVADKFVRDYFQKEFEAPLKATERPVDKVMQERVVAFAAWNSFSKATTPESERHTWVASEKKRLQDLPEDELRGILGQWHVTLGGLHRQFITAFLSNAEKAKEGVQVLEAQHAKFKEELLLNGAHLLDTKARQTKLMADLNSAQKGLGNFRFFSARAGGKGAGVMQGATDEQRVWLTDLCSNPELADVARAALRSTKAETATYHIIDGMRMAGHLKRVLMTGPKGVAQDAEADQRQRAKDGRDLLRNAMLIQIEDLRAQREKLKVELKASHAQRDGILIGLDTVKVREALFYSAAKGRTPQFLEQYEGLKRAGIPMPVLARRQRSQDIAPGKQAERAVQSFEDLNRKIISTLNALKGDVSSDDAFQVDTYFRAITDATAGSQKQLAKREAAETALKEKLATKSLEEYLLEQNTTQAATAAVPEKSRRINRSPDFDI
ncbi:MAG: hypothetical protein Q7T82_11370 [Armatimonadota bacterium]|nr:hypothetical protein [Armatimonadota bacterium]